MTTEIINPPETDEEMFISYIDKIRKEVERAADNWLHIAYYVYELNYFGYYKKHFDNIVDCCQANFGFKKSTTYNFINIVEQFADKRSFTVGMVKSKPKLQFVGFNDFFSAVRKWSYSQLVAMLSLSDKQRKRNAGNGQHHDATHQKRFPHNRISLCRADGSQKGTPHAVKP